jgi:hypothetical protein
VDALAARTLVKGEALAPPAGRADDYAWPRREIGREQAKGDTPVAAASPGGTVAACTWTEAAFAAAAAANATTAKAAAAAVPMQIRPAQNNGPTLRDFFGGFGARAASAWAACGRAAAWTLGAGRSAPAG